MDALEILNNALVITLKKRPDRTKALASRWFDATGKVPTLHYGFDGKKLPIPTEWKTSEGAFGACLARVTAWARALSDFDYELDSPLAFFEDDVVFCKDFFCKLDWVAKNVPNDWEILYLGGERLSGRPMRENVATNGEITISREVNVNRLHAYVVKPRSLTKMFPRLLEYATRAPSFSGATGDETCFDYEIGRMVENKELVAYGVSPWLCGQGGFGSDTYERANLGASVERYWNF